MLHQWSLDITCAVICQRTLLNVWLQYFAKCQSVYQSTHKVKKNKKKNKILCSARRSLDSHAQNGHESVNGYSIANFQRNKALFSTSNLTECLEVNRRPTLKMALFYYQPLTYSFNACLKMKLMYGRYLFFEFLSLSSWYQLYWASQLLTTWSSGSLLHLYFKVS